MGTVPVTAFLSAVSKTAGFILILRLVLSLFLTASGDRFGALNFLEKYNGYIAAMAAVTIIVGNVVAVQQKNIKRLFAYASIAHAGYLLAAVATLGGGYFLLDTIWYYLLAYLLMTLGVFAIIQLLSEKSGTEDITMLAGLARTSPYLGIVFTVYILSMAGIPGTAGFIGKVNILLGAFISEPGHFVLAGFLLAGTVISYVYYFRMLVQVFFRPAVQTRPIRIPACLSLVLIICLAGTVVFGIAPNLPLDFLHEQFGDFTAFLSTE